jgi:hypothetical protein
MKKIICILSVIIMLLSPIGLAQIADQNDEIKTINHIQKSLDTKDPPNWATGEFNGTWGLSLLGAPIAELGWVEGYFSAIGVFGRIEAEFAEWKDEEATARLEGFVILFYMLGVIGNITSTEETFFMGLGTPNENGEFYYRISLILGPSWYMVGTWREI